AVLKREDSMLGGEHDVQIDLGEGLGHGCVSTEITRFLPRTTAELFVFTPKALYSVAQGRESSSAPWGTITHPKASTRTWLATLPGARHRSPRVRPQSRATLGCGIQPLRGKKPNGIVPQGALRDPGLRNTTPSV